MRKVFIPKQLYDALSEFVKDKKPEDLMFYDKEVTNEKAGKQVQNFASSCFKGTFSDIPNIHAVRGSVCTHFANQGCSATDV